MIGGDSTATWQYNQQIWRPSNNNSSNRIQAFTGLAEEQINADFRQTVTVAVGASNGIGLNSTTVPSGYVGILGNNIGGGTILVPGVANFIASPLLGINNFQMIEFGNSSGQPTFEGTQPSMQLSVTYRG